MLSLYYSKGTCSLGPHIVLKELDLPHELRLIDPRKGDDQSPDFLKLNALGQVPVLITENQEVITESSAILQYLADLKPAQKLAPPSGTLERVRLQEWLNFISTEVHKAFGPLFSGKEMVPSEAGLAELDRWARKNLMEHLAIAEARLGTAESCLPSGFSVADAYLFAVLTWCKYTKVDLALLPRLSSYFESIRRRPSVQKAIVAEGIRSLALPQA
jgi:glutathione S-transferase